MALTRRKRDLYYRRKYGLTLKQWEKMAARHKGGCWICFRPPKRTRRHNTDHDHKTKRVRGILCFRCNHRLLGRGLEDPTLHERAAQYLRSTFDGRNL